jgi:hypothetical protein
VRTHGVSARALTPALALLVLAGCGGSGGRDDRAAATTAATTATQATPPARGATPPARPSPYDPPARVPRQGTGALADPGQIAVVRRWVDRLRAGDVAGAAATFADGARIQNGAGVVTLRSRVDRRLYLDEGFPCGARVAAAEDARGGFVLVEFTLTGRRGGDPYGCAGGGSAYAAIRVAGGRIREWYRVPEPPAPADATTS